MATANRSSTAMTSSATRSGAVLILRLRTKQTVAIRRAVDGADLLAHTDPASTVTAFRDLTSLDAQPR